MLFLDQSGTRQAQVGPCADDMDAEYFWQQFQGSYRKSFKRVLALRLKLSCQVCAVQSSSIPSLRTWQAGVAPKLPPRRSSSTKKALAQIALSARTGTSCRPGNRDILTIARHRGSDHEFKVTNRKKNQENTNHHKARSAKCRTDVGLNKPVTMGHN